MHRMWRLSTHIYPFVQEKQYCKECLPISSKLHSCKWNKYTTTPPNSPCPHKALPIRASKSPSVLDFNHGRWYQNFCWSLIVDEGLNQSMMVFCLFHRVMMNSLSCHFTLVNLMISMMILSTHSLTKRTQHVPLHMTWNLAQ